MYHELFLGIRAWDAVDTIRGYYYQISYSILCILAGNEDDEVIVEDIEDVDAASGDEKVAIQCKYFLRRSITIL